MVGALETSLFRIPFYKLQVLGYLSFANPAASNVLGFSCSLGRVSSEGFPF